MLNSPGHNAQLLRKMESDDREATKANEATKKELQVKRDLGEIQILLIDGKTHGNIYWYILLYVHHRVEERGRC